MKWFERWRHRRQRSDPFAITESPLEIEPAGNEQPTEGVALQALLDEQRESIRKLGRTQFRANTVAESERKEIQQMLAQLLDASQGLQREVLHELLLVVDGLEEGIRAGERSQTVDLQANVWTEGLEILHKRMLRVLQKSNVAPMDAVGKPFDPHCHRAVEAVDGADAEPNTVVAEQQRGYFIGDDVLRYAEVIVTKNQENRT